MKDRRTAAQPRPRHRASADSARPTAAGWRRGSGCPRMPRAGRCRRSSNTFPIASATARARATSRCMAISPATATPRSASTCAAPAIPTACCIDEYLQQEQDDALEVDRLDRAPALVQRRRRHDGQVLGRLQRAAGRRAPAAGAEGDHHRLLDRRPLRRRHPLHGRLPAQRQSVVGHRSCWPTARGRPIRRSSARAGARRWLERLEPRCLLPRPVARAISAATPTGGTARSARTTPRSAARSMPSAAGPTAIRNAVPRLLAGLQRAAQGADRALGASSTRMTASPARRSASSRRRCAGGITG